MRKKDLKIVQPKGSTFVIYWYYLFMLLQNCLTCAAPSHIKKIITKDSVVCIHLLCQNGHFNVCRSQPSQNCPYIGNLRLLAAVLFGCNIYCKLSKYFKIMNLSWASKSCYYKSQDKYMFGIANEAWKKEQEMNILQSNQRYLILSGDDHCDSLGHNAKDLNYSLYDQHSKKILATSHN